MEATGVEVEVAMWNVYPSPHAGGLGVYILSSVMRAEKTP